MSFVSNLFFYLVKVSHTHSHLLLSIEFRVGQLYNSERDVGSHVNAADPIDTTLTTKGYLSDGNNHPITINGEFGGDLFDVLRNKDGKKQ